MKTVIIVGTLGPYTLDPEGAEVWACNKAYLAQPNATRIYFFDPLKEWLKPDKVQEFIEDVNRLDIPVICQDHDPRIPKSERYPIEEIIETLGITYFTSTMAYMVADAIRLGFEKIVMHRIYNISQSYEYFCQKCCLDFLLGYALGKGIKISISDDSHLCREHPWQPPVYGYSRLEGMDWVSHALAVQVLNTIKMPVRFKDTNKVTEKLIEMKKQSIVERYPSGEPREFYTSKENGGVFIEQFAEPEYIRMEGV